MDYGKDANQKSKKNYRSKAKKRKNKVGTILLRTFIIIILLGSFAVVGGGLGIYLGIVDSAPPLNLMQIVPQSYNTIIVDENGNELDRLHGEENREYATLAEIPKNLQNAVIAIEDERFYTHNGIDIRGMMRAVVKDIQTLSLDEGASTITQQLIKNNVIQNNEKKFKRKLQEQYLALEYEKQLATMLGSKKAAKDYILELYLNTLGLNHGLSGVKSAAQRYFNKDVSELTLGESAVLAAITKNPSKFTPILKPENNRERQKLVLGKMLDLKMISQSEHDAALAEPVYEEVANAAEQLEATESHHSYFTDQLIETLAEDLKVQKGMSPNQSFNLIYSGGLTIVSTQNTDMQKIADNAYKNDALFPPKDYSIKITYRANIEKSITKKQEVIKRDGTVKNKGEVDTFVAGVRKEFTDAGDKIVKDSYEAIIEPQSAFVLMDPHTGEVKVLVGGRGEKLGDRTFNRATQAVRQPGSVFKVLAAYLPAIDTGKVTPATIINDEPYKIGGYEPKNWYSGYRGPSTVRVGIRDSMNILAVKTMMNTGIQTCYDYLINLGFTTLVDSEERNGQVFSDKTASTALGGLTDGVTPLEMTAAYAAIANEGVYNKPIFYTKVLDHDGNVFLENVPAPRQVIKKSTAFLLTDMMKDVITSGTGKLAAFKKIKMPISGKTGTTSDDKDLTFAGFTPYYVAGIWLGHDKPKPLRYDKSYHLLLWSNIMEQIHKDLPYKDFEKPADVKSVKLCTVSGKLAVDGLCDSDPTGSKVRYEYFATGTQPTESCSVHARVKIDTSTNKLATEYCPADLVKEVVKVIGQNTANLSPEDIAKRNLAPTDYCTVHGPQSSTNQPTPNESEQPIVPNNDLYIEDPHSNTQNGVTPAPEQPIVTPSPSTDPNPTPSIDNFNFVQ